MPTYRSRNLKFGAPALPDPTAIPLHGTSLQTAHNALKSIDTLVESGARVHMRFGMLGGHKLLIANGTDPSSASRVYPDNTTARIVARTNKITLTPGSFVGLSIVALPSGPTQLEELDGDFVQDGAGGRVVLEVTYTNSDAQSVTVYSEISLAASNEIWAAEPPSGFHSLIVQDKIAIPQQLINSAAHWEKWTRGKDVTASCIVREYGSPRVIDGAIIEHPHSITVDNADTIWPTAMYTQGSQPYVNAPSDYPVTQIATADPGGGVGSIRRALYSHGRQLGPILISWTSASVASTTLAEWISYDSGTGDDEAPPYTVTGTTDTLVPYGITSASANNPGWSLGCYARDVDDGNAFLDGRAGVMAVWVDAYCRVSAGTGTFRLRAGDKNFTDEVMWTTTSTTWGWVRTFGRLEIGTSPENTLRARLWAKNSGANDTEIRYLHVHKFVKQT